MNESEDKVTKFSTVTRALGASILQLGISKVSSFEKIPLQQPPKVSNFPWRHSRNQPGLQCQQKILLLNKSGE